MSPGLFRGDRRIQRSIGRAGSAGHRSVGSAAPGRSGGGMRPFDERGAFRVATELDELRSVAVRGAGVTMLSQITALAIQIGGTVVLARLLTPVDFGLIAMVTTFSLLLMNFGVNGFTEAVIQREHVDHALVSNLFWINASVGLVLTIAFAMAGHLLA